MTKFVGIASGKGGVGKTTLAVNLATEFNNMGYDTTLLDGNLATPHIAMHLGSPLLPITINNVLKAENNLDEAIYVHPSGLKIIPSSISIDDINETNPRRLSNLLLDQEMGDIVIIDFSSGLTTDVKPLLNLIDEILIITNPDMPSVTEALKTIKLAKRNNVTIAGVILNKKSKNDLMTKQEISTILEHKILAEIPEHKHFKTSLKLGQPLIYSFPNSMPAQQIKKLTANLAGKEYKQTAKQTIFLNNLLNFLKIK